MNDRALIRTGMAGAVIAAICCATPVLAMALPVVGLSTWLTGAGLVELSLAVACLGFVAWSVRHGRANVAFSNTKILNEGVKP
ncbi:mercury transport protein [Mesorhizobium loti]|uniref:Mercury transport protein n=1 Tax=Rhizobium loti TaxID=381 RepID=A0A101KRR0_RHILI|nr:mercury transport protein [Mesorhizobium loti]